MSKIQTIKGFADLYFPLSDLYTRMEDTARRVFGAYGYKELRTPILEYTDLFKRSIGMETDVVQKEMYTFPDRKGRSLTMRPEATAGVMRSYIENNMHAREGVSKFFTYGPMFRHERPQKGRMRQFHQINAECLGPEQPEADAELICMLMDYLASLGLSELDLQINSLGCPKCRPAYRKLLRDWLAALDPAALCEDCRRRMETNPLRVLDCKSPSCREHTEAAPMMLDHNCPECRTHFSTVTRLLQASGVNYVINHRLVRGLDYYVRTCFEVVSNNIGSQGSVAGGGRYDGLISALGGPEVSGLGFACGMERLAMLMQEEAAPRSDFFLAVLAEECKDAAFALAQSLRAAGLGGVQSFESRSMKSVMRQADKSGARFALILGPDELAAGNVVIKNMDNGDQNPVSLEGAASAIIAAGKIS